MEGGLEIIGGGFYVSGNDMFFGFNVGGKLVYVEKGEVYMVLKFGLIWKYKFIFLDIF